MLNRFILGILEDNVNPITIPELSRVVGSYKIPWYGFPEGQHFEFLNSNQPLMWIPFSFLASILGGAFAYNLFILSAKILIFYGTFLFIKKFTDSRVISALVAIIFSVNSYVLYQSRSHVDLVQIWVYPLLLLFLMRVSSNRSAIYTGVFVGLVGLMSNYLGFFCLIVMTLYFLFKFLISKSKRENGAVNYFKYLLVSGVSVITIIAIFLYPYVKANYFSRPEEIANTAYQYNNLENFFYFSSRPWYYLIPPAESVFLGNLSDSMISFLQNNWGYWLTSNYFPSEHNAAYLGFANMIMAIAGAYVVFKRKAKYKKELLVFVAIAFGLVLLSSPPYITVSMYKIYTPGYLVWQVFPMFRSLSRVGPLVLLMILPLVTHGYVFVFETLKKRAGNIFVSYAAISLVFIIALMEFFIPQKVLDVSKMPQAFEYIKNETPLNAVIVVYPYSKTIEGALWLKEYRRPFINPNGFKSSTGFNSEDFTNNLNRCENLSYAKNLGADYLIYFNKAKDNDQNFFERSGMLEEVKRFDFNNSSTEDHIFYSLKNMGDTSETSAIIYKFKDTNENCIE